MDRDEWLKNWNLYGRIEDRRKDGAHLTKAQEELLTEASWQSYRKVTEKKRPKPMTPAQRAVKADLLSSWRTALQSLRLVNEAFPHGKDATAWFKEKDLRKVLDRFTICDLVRTSVYHFGTEYADAILDVLKDVYTRQSEDLVIIRGLQSWVSLPQKRPFASR